MPKLAHLDRATGLSVRKPPTVRYEKEAPGEFVHVDIKKLGRIPGGGWWSMLGRTIGNRNNKKQGLGYAYLHHGFDDHSRLVYSEILDDEMQETAAGFWRRARTYFQSVEISVTAVVTDNSSCHRARTFALALGTGVKHYRTMPYRPQANGKVERFDRTLAAEWAYADAYASDAARPAAYADRLHHYNHHRPHAGIGGLTPSDRVHNLTGNFN